MNVEELQFINSKVNIINRKKMFTDVLNNFNRIRAANNGKDKEEKSFLEELDDRTNKSEKLKDVLKGNAFYLEPKKVVNTFRKKNQSVSYKIRSRNIKKLTTSEAEINNSNNNETTFNNDIQGLIKKEEIKVKGILKTTRKKTSENNILKHSFKLGSSTSVNTNYNNLNLRPIDLSPITVIKQISGNLPDDSGIFKLQEIQKMTKDTESDIFMTDLQNMVNSSTLEKKNLTPFSKNSNKKVNISNLEINQNINYDQEFIHINPNLNAALYEQELGNRRRAFILADNKQVNQFLKAIESKTQRKMNKKYELIPKAKIDNVIKVGTTLNKIYYKCMHEIKIAEEVEKVMIREKNKELSNSQKENEQNMKKLESKQDLNLNEDKNKEEKQHKVFIYNGGKGQGQFVGRGNGEVNKINFVDKISENLAFTNRDTLIKKLGYNYNKDPDFIFRDETIKKQKKEELKKMMIEKLKRKERDKHELVENILEKTIKRKDHLIERIQNDFVRINKLKRDEESDFDENYPIDFLSIIKSHSDFVTPKREHANKLSKSVDRSTKKLNKNKNNSMIDLKTTGNLALPKIENTVSNKE